MRDPFIFKKKIECGGFAEVWLATDIGLNSDCVVKRIPPDKIINQKNFFSEAQILKKVEHSNIVRVFGSDILSNGDIYISMEYLKRGSLDKEIEKGYVPLSKAVKLMVDVLRGLEYAHSKKIIHRDIKPANILIGDALEGKLSDFGLAVSDINSLDPHSLQSHKYRAHLAPEVKKLKDFSCLSDIYACGVTLYRLVNGDKYIKNVPFERIKEEAALGRFPDRNLYREFVPKSLRRIINRSLNIIPSLRYQTAEAMKRALERITIGENWNEQDVPCGKKWCTSGKNGYCEIERICITTQRWKIITKKGKSKKSLRSIRNLCFDNLSEKEAIRNTGKILQNKI